MWCLKLDIVLELRYSYSWVTYLWFFFFYFFAHLTLDFSRPQHVTSHNIWDQWVLVTVWAHCLVFRSCLQSFCLVHSWFMQMVPRTEVLKFAFSPLQPCLFQVIPPIAQDYLVHFQSAQGPSLKLITICRCIKCTLYFIIWVINENTK